jgi:hypothetical protein
MMPYDTFTPCKMIILSICISVKLIQIITKCDLGRNGHNWEFFFDFFQKQSIGTLGRGKRE